MKKETPRKQRRRNFEIFVDTDLFFIDAVLFDGRSSHSIWILIVAGVSLFVLEAKLTFKYFKPASHVTSFLIFPAVHFTLQVSWHALVSACSASQSTSKAGSAFGHIIVWFSLPSVSEERKSNKTLIWTENISGLLEVETRPLLVGLGWTWSWASMKHCLLDKCQRNSVTRHQSTKTESKC